MEIKDSINKVTRAIQSLKRGELVILTDDENREHEGDLVGLAAFATPEAVNFALKKARGVLTVPMSKDRALNLGLTQMVENNTEKFGTKFTISVDHIASTTGVSAYERANTIKQLANLSTRKNDFEEPGHVFPLVAEDGGVLTRVGHTEGAVDLARLAGVTPIAYIIEILSDDGNMAREKELNKLAEQASLLQLSIQDIINYRQYIEERNIKPGITVHLPSSYGDFNLTEFNTENERPNILIESRGAHQNDVPLVRLHSECITGEVFGSLRCECGPQLHAALKTINEQGGAIVYLPQEGRGIGLHEKLKSYVLQENGYDTYDANVALGHQPDERDYKQAAEILKLVGMTKIRLLTNNPDKIQALTDNGIEIVEHVPLITGVNDINKKYIQTKREKFKHLL